MATETLASFMQSGLFSVSPEIILVIDPWGVIVGANRRLYEWLGHDESKVVGRHVTTLSFVPLGQRLHLGIQFIRRMAGEPVARYECEVITSSGEHRFGSVNGARITSAEGKVLGAVIMVSDVTEMHEVKRELDRNDRQFAEFLDVVDGLFVVLTPEGNIVNLNGYALRVLGKTADACKGKDWVSLAVPEHRREATKAALRQLLDGHNAVEGYNDTVIGVGGTERLISWHITVQRGKSGNIERYIIFGTDVTEQHATREMLEKNGRKYRALLEQGSEGTVVVDAGGVITYANRTVETLLGYSPEEMIGQSMFRYVYPSDLSFTQDNLDKLKADAASEVDQTLRLVRKNGETVWVGARAANRLGDPDLAGVVIKVNDVSHEKTTEQASARMQAIIDRAAVGVMFFDHTGTVTYANNRLCEMHGYGHGELVGKTIPGVSGDNVDVEKMWGLLKKSRFIHMDGLGHKPDGTVFDVDLDLTYIDFGGDGIGVAFVQDNTARKTEDRRIRADNAFLSGIVNGVADPLFVKDADRKWIFVNDAFLELVGRKREEIIGKTDYDVFPKNQVDGYLDTERSVLKTGVSTSYRIMFPDVQGKQRTIGVAVKSGKDETGHPVLIGSIRDLTEIEAARADAVSSELLHKITIDALDYGIVTLDSALTVLMNNAASKTYFRPDFADSIAKGAPISDVLLPGLDISREMDMVRQTGRGVSAARRWHAGAEERIVEISILPVIGTMAQDRSILVFHDVTETYGRQAELRRQHDFLDILFATIPTPLFVKDREGKYLMCNPAYERTLRRPKHDIVGKTVYDIYPQESAAKLDDMDRRVTETHALQAYDDDLVLPDGSKRHYTFSKAPMYTESGEMSGLVGMMTDTTDMKRAEEALRQSESKFRVLFDTAPDGMYLIDMTGKFVDGNDAAAAMVGYGKNDIIGRNMMEANLFPERSVPAVTGILIRSANGQPTGPDEIELLRKDGSTAVVEILTHPVTIDGVRYAFGIMRDISVRKAADDELMRKNQELERLNKLMVGRELKMVELKSQLTTEKEQP